MFILINTGINIIIDGHKMDISQLLIPRDALKKV